MRRLNISICFFCVIAALAALSGSAIAEEKPLYRDAVDETGTYSCLSPEEAELFFLINEYRETNGLPPLRNSRSLTKVARLHAIDINLNRPDQGLDVQGRQCSLHSWSDRGFWSPLCYTSSQNDGEKMLNKAREVTADLYPGEANENVFLTSEKSAVPRRVLEVWKKSSVHNALLLENGPWKGSNFLALGVGIYKNIAVMWVGAMMDPAGEMSSCNTGR